MAPATFAVTRWFNGRLDDLAVFNAALPAAEIAKLATRPVAYMGGFSATNTVSFYVARRPSLSVVPAANGSFALSVNGDVGPAYLVQASTNLLNWATILSTNYPPQGWIDPDTATFTRRYYRVSVEP